MKTITLYLAVFNEDPDRIIPWLVPIDDRMLELGYTQIGEQEIEIDQFEPHVIAAAIERGNKQREALKKQHNNVPMFIRDKKENAA